MELFNSSLPYSSWFLYIIRPFKHLDAAKFSYIALWFHFSSVPFETIEYHLWKRARGTEGKEWSESQGHMIQEFDPYWHRPLVLRIKQWAAILESLVLAISFDRI